MVVAIDPRVELFGIGDSLRETRLRQGIDLGEVEASTCIRAYNLDLIEQERWESLPGDVYTAGFIRTYAEYLGLDGDRYVDVFKEIRELDAEPAVYEPVLAEPGPRRLLLAVVALLVVAGLAAAAVFLRGDGAKGPAAVTTAPATAKPKAAAPVARLHGSLALRAARADSWVVVRFDSSKGKLVWQGTLRRGHRLRLGLDRPLFVGLGKPEAVDVSVGGKRLVLPGSRSLFVFSRAGVRSVRG